MFNICKRTYRKNVMKVIINPKYIYLQKRIESILDCFEMDGDIVYDGRNILKRINLDNVDVVVKSFKKPHVINRVIYSFFRQSKAERSYLYSMELQKRGFDTPDPIAMIEQYSKALLSHSYYICCYDNGETVRSLMDGKVEGNEDKLLAFARYTVALHQAGILHLDYSPGNILIHRNGVNEYRFSLVDVNRMQLLSDIDCDTVCRNMCRLCISREVLTYIMTEYATLRGWNVSATVQLALYYSDKFFIHYVYRRAARKETVKHIHSFILMFRLSRSIRNLLFKKSSISRTLLKLEKRIYTTYLSKYDYCDLLSFDYQ